MNTIQSTGTSQNPYIGAPETTTPASPPTPLGDAQSALRIPLHRICAQSNATPGYIPAMSNDPLGIVASYLEETDQRVMREVDALMHVAVDRQIDILTISAKDACAIFRHPNAFCALRELRLTDCGNADLIDLVAILKTLPHTQFALILDQKANAFVNARGFTALAEVAFSSITLKNIDLSPADAQALARGTSPVSISIPALSFEKPDVAYLLQIPTLSSLIASPHPFPNNIRSAVTSHTCLSELLVGAISSVSLCDISKSATIETLSISEIDGPEAGALSAIADNATLRSLTIGSIHRPQSLVTLSRNSALRSVTLGVFRDAQIALPHLANMTGLEVLSLRSASSLSTQLPAENIQALCEKSFRSLDLHDWDIEPAAQLLIATSQSHHLSLNHATPFSEAAIHALSMNPAITSLSVEGSIFTAAHAITLAGVPTLQSLQLSIDMIFSPLEKVAISKAWQAAHKPLANLRLGESGMTFEDAATHV